MEKKYFTDEQVEELRKNPYVKNVSEKAITYTEDFKEAFFKALQEGKPPVLILREMGFDTKALGQKRITTISHRIKKEAMRTERFSDTRKGKSGRIKTKDMTQEEYVKYLEHQVKLQKQQIEALKKMKQVEREAYWKYSRALKRSSK